MIPGGPSSDQAGLVPEERVGGSSGAAELGLREQNPRKQAGGLPGRALEPGAGQAGEVRSVMQQHLPIPSSPIPCFGSLCYSVPMSIFGAGGRH